MNNTSTRFLYLAFVLAIVFGILPFLAFAQELPSGMTKEEFCEMLKNKQRPSMPQGARFPDGSQPPPGGGFQGKARPDGMTPPEGDKRPEGFAPPNIDCGDLESAPKTPTTQTAAPLPVKSVVKSTTTAPRIPVAPSASSTREKSKLDQLIEEDKQRSFYGLETTFSGGASDDTNQNAGFFGGIISRVASVVRSILGWFQR